MSPSTDGTVQSMEIKSETVLTASSGRETLIVRFDGNVAHLAIDENDNGAILSVTGDRELLDAFCKGLDGKEVEPDERRVKTLLETPQAGAELVASEEGYELVLSAAGERSRTFRFPLTDGANLRKAVRGTFGFWD